MGLFLGLSAAAWVGISAAVAAAGVGVSLYAASAQADAQQQTLKFQQKAREQEAESARQSAQFEEHQFRRRLSILTGKQDAIVAATGLDPSSGTLFLMALDTAKQGEMEALNIRRTGAISAAGSDLEARLTRLKLGQVGQAGTYNMIGTSLSGASSVLGTWASSQGVNRRSTKASGYGNYGAYGDYSY